MDLRNYLSILWRRKWIILITVIVTTSLVVLATLLMQPKYSATTTMRISLVSGGSVSYYDYMYADRLINTYVDLATSTPVLDQLKQRLSLDALPKIEVNTVSNTELIRISTDYAEPNTAALITNTLADILISKSLELYSGGGKSSLEILSEQVSAMQAEVNQAKAEYLNVVDNNPDDTVGIQTAKENLDFKQEMYASILDQYEQARLKESQRANSISVVEPAIAAIKPSKPNKILNIALGLVVGGIGGIGLAFLYENIDTTLYTTEQIETATKLPVIGKIPSLKRLNSFNSLNINFAYGESFRRLRTNILSSEIPIRSLLITSPGPKEGKSRIVADLAFMMVQSGRKVIVVDADMRVPSVDKIFDIDNNVGLSSVLDHKDVLIDAIQVSEFSGVHVLTSGPLPTNPSELLGSDQMKILIDKLSQTYDLVIIDTPAALAVADVAILTPLVDAIALVVSRARTNARDVGTLLAQLKRDNTSWIGVIINRAEINHSPYYYNRAY